MSRFVRLLIITIVPLLVFSCTRNKREIATVNRSGRSCIELLRIILPSSRNVVQDGIVTYVKRLPLPMAKNNLPEEIAQSFRGRSIQVTSSHEITDIVIEATDIGKMYGLNGELLRDSDFIASVNSNLSKIKAAFKHWIDQDAFIDFDPNTTRKSRLLIENLRPSEVPRPSTELEYEINLIQLAKASKYENSVQRKLHNQMLQTSSINQEGTILEFGFFFTQEEPFARRNRIRGIVYELDLDDLESLFRGKNIEGEVHFFDYGTFNSQPYHHIASGPVTFKSMSE